MLQTMVKPVKWQTPVPTPEQARERYEFMDRVVRTIRENGVQLNELESALGMYVLAFHVGWKPLYLIHTKRTIKKYEDLLGIKLSEQFDDYGPDADRTNAAKIAKAASNFWKAVSGESKPMGEVDKRGFR
jgi:hypothetical protein